GVSGYTSNPCCDASTCRLTEGSQCAHGLCCDNCQFAVSGSVCRKTSRDCDLPEYCTGVSQDCPEDRFEMNGKPCYDQAQGYCYDGRCPTYEQHCWRLFGQGSRVGPDMCFDLNKRGEEGANCGRSRTGYVSCARPYVSSKYINHLGCLVCIVFFHGQKSASCRPTLGSVSMCAKKKALHFCPVSMATVC
uniref:Disintegrin domain-containing protein n=1 Tax=Labrus bergylta TaxID=56723 RepID=A0A3Q3EQY7_9LABR